MGMIRIANIGFFLLSCLLLQSLLSWSLHAETLPTTVFGPENYIRTAPKPNVYTATFSAQTGAARILVHNGDEDGTNRSASAFIKINDVQIFSPADFNHGASTLEALISLSDSNTIEVTLASSPGSFMNIEILQDLAPVTVILPEPTASINAEPASIASGETASLTWSTEYTQTCTIEPDIGIVPCTSDLTVAPLQDTTYILTASGQGGTTTARTTVTVTEASPLSLTITSPLNGDNLSQPFVMVTGTLTHENGLETGITVNGVIGLIYDGIFVANHVPLAEGENSISVKAVSETGDYTEQTISITAASSTRYVELHTDLESVIAPTEITLILNSNFNVAVQPEFSCNGPAEAEFLLDAESNTWSTDISEPGIYFLTVEVQDENGTYYRDTAAVMAMDRAVLDAILQARWSGMKEALLLNNIEDAVSFFSDSSRTVYNNRFQFLANAGALAQVINTMGAFNLVEHDGYGVVYDLRSTRDGMEYSFQVLFVQDTDGIWRIKNF